VKPRLIVLLGAGSTAQLNPDTLHGMPSTDELTTLVSQMQFPKLIMCGTPFLHTEATNKSFAWNSAVPALQVLHRVLLNTFESVNFELILYAIDQLLPLTDMRAGAASWDRVLPAIAAFVEMRRNSEILNDGSLLRATRDCIISKIHSEIQTRSFQLPLGDLPLHKLINALAAEFNLQIFTLNYDDIVDRARNDWFDGFLGETRSSTSGECKSFDVRAFESWRDLSEPILIHLHGSVRFGPLWGCVDLVKYSEMRAAGEALQGPIGGYTSVGGQEVGAVPLISGLNKAARLILNPVPFGYYYRALIDSLLSNERLLVIGYGARDEHVNTWLNQFKAKHGERSRVVWVGKLTGKMVGTRTPEKDRITLLSDHQFKDSLHHSTHNEQHSLIECGRLHLWTAGFPFPDETASELISFLRG
jgi:SIR2-like domain